MASPAKKISLKKKVIRKSPVSKAVALRKPLPLRKKVPTKKAVSKKSLALVTVLSQKAVRSPRRSSRDLPVIDADVSIQGVQISTEPPPYVNGQNIQWNHANGDSEIKQLAPPQPAPLPPEIVKKEGRFDPRAQKILGVNKWGKPVRPDSLVLEDRHRDESKNHHSLTLAALRTLRVKVKNIIQKFSGTDTSK